LAIVKHIVSRHQGRLTIESRPGEGSTFTVSLPVAPGEIMPKSPLPVAVTEVL
jgi:two-component system phosphate regulon sensor histidine kinase PhoR